MYIITVNNEKKAFIIEASGFFGQDEVKQFLKEYQDKVKSINPMNYNFIICGKDLKTSTQDMADMLDNCLRMYQASGFKKYYFTKPASPTAWMQLNKLLQKNKLDMTMGESVESILSNL